MCFPCCFTISTAEVGMIETWGKYSRQANPGLGFVICPMESLVGRLSFRVQQLDVRVETKTLDNVFLTATVSVQFQVLREKSFEGGGDTAKPNQRADSRRRCSQAVIFKEQGHAPLDDTATGRIGPRDDPQFNASCPELRATRPVGSNRSSPWCGLLPTERAP